MKLDRLILVNWGQLRPGNFDMGDMTLLTGETGSGKSTMLDGLQTIMTAANKGIMNYNPGQDEVTQGQRRGKTKRTLESYIVGAEYNNFSRKDGSQGYMAAVFRPGQGEEHLKAFTAVVAASARVEGSGESRQARLESLSLVIVDDAALTFEDFVKDAESNEYISVDRIVRHLQSKYSLVREFHDKKMDYLCALYGRFRGKSSVTKDEASNAARAWVQSIAYRPIGSVHELVRDEILDFDERQLQQDIERISGLMRQVSNLRQESQRLQANVAKLDKLHQSIVAANAAHVEQVQQATLVAKLHLKTNEEQAQAKANLIKESEVVEEQESAKILAWKKRVGLLDGQRVTIAARLQGIPAHNQKIELESLLSSATATARQTLEALRYSLNSAVVLDQAAVRIAGTAIPDYCKHLKVAVAKVQLVHSRIDFHRLGMCRDIVEEVVVANELNLERLYDLAQAFGGVNVGIDELHGALIGQDDSVALAGASDATTVVQQKQRADDRVRDLKSQRARLAQGKVVYPNKVDFALTLLQEQFPSANAQVLCDLIEPKSEKWQSVIESYMDGARFNLVVHPEWERRCIDFLKAKDAHVKVVQGGMCMASIKGKKLPDDSVVHELKSENPIAWAYLVDQFGGVVKVSDTQDLLNAGRGVTLSGVGSGGRTMYPLKPVTNVFGQKSRQQAFERVSQDLEVAEQEAQVWADGKNYLDSLKLSLQGIRQPQFNAEPLRDAGTQIEKAKQALSNLDLSTLGELEAALASIEEEIRNYRGWIDEATKRQGAQGEIIKNAHTAIRNLQIERQRMLEELEAHIRKVQSLTQVDLSLSYPDLMAKVNEEVELGKTSLEQARTALRELVARPEHLLVDVRTLLSDYNAHAKSDERFLVELQQRHDTLSFDANYPVLVGLQSTVAKALEGLRGIGLYNNSQDLDQAERSFHDVFTKQFCVEIKSRVDEGIRTLRQMNAELKNLKFGQDSFSIDWSRWEPEFEDYLGFFDAVTKLADSTESLDLFGEVSLSQKHIQIRDRIVKLLLDDDHERATKELLRIADYRNYRHYDIINDTTSGGRVRLSEWGTGSGGQLETPAYIVRAAVVTNRLKLFEKGASLNLLVNDESFAKMDEPRARAVLGFLRDKLDLQVISAMPTMKAGALKDEFNREYSFTRLKGVANGELDFISECDERIFKTDRMRELWERQRVIAREKAKQLFDATNPEDVATESTVEGA